MHSYQSLFYNKIVIIMKKTIFFFLSMCSFAMGQNLNNTFCDAADLACKIGSGMTRDFDLRKTDPLFGIFCPTTSTSLFYEIKTSGVATPSIGSFNTSTSTTFKLYGPFESLREGCEVFNDAGLTSVYSSGSAATYHSLYYNMDLSKTYILEVIFSGCNGSINFMINGELPCRDEVSCKDCLKSFMPTPGKYIVSAWVKKEGAAPLDTNYNAASLKVSCPSVAGSTNYFYPSGQLIDGWKRIEGVYTISSLASNFELKLNVTSGIYLFDDIRMFPYDGSMISYVYDPINLRLVAELDERNYAKLYEYDEEGKLIRVKKETEMGVMTIQENRENSKR